MYLVCKDDRNATSIQGANGICADSIMNALIAKRVFKIENIGLSMLALPLIVKKPKM